MKSYPRLYPSTGPTHGLKGDRVEQEVAWCHQRKKLLALYNEIIASATPDSRL